MTPVNEIKSTSTWRFQTGIFGAGIFGVGLATFLSVKSSPSMSGVGWLPHFIIHWADRHGQLCNFPAYAMLAIPFLALAPGRLQRAGLLTSWAAVEMVAAIWRKMFGSNAGIRVAGGKIPVS
jgi:hypothetical protein